MKHHVFLETLTDWLKLSADAKRVVRKEQHIMMDEEFTQGYALTVFPFSTDVCMVWFYFA